MARTKVKIDLDRLRVLQVGVSLAAPEIAAATRQTFNLANVRTPVDTGNLRAQNKQTIRARRTSVTGEISNNAKYATAVHNGTRPHTISAKRAGALAFNWKARGGIRVVVPKKPGGGTGIRKSKSGKVVLWVGKGFVRHPGTKARPWLDDALREMARLRGYRYTPGPGLLGSRV